MKKVLIIQTAFIGDVILATALLESIRQFYKENVEIDILVRRGNEALVQNHPFVHKVFVWDKKSRKYKNLFVLAKQIRTVKYDVVFNLQRFASTGFLTFLAKATAKVGFRKNPFAFSFTHKIAHEIGNGQHEIERNHNLLKAVVKNAVLCKPKLYPSKLEQQSVEAFIKDKIYYVFAPSSVWFTKQLPKEKWIELLRMKAGKGQLFLIGAPSDKAFLDEIISAAEVHGCLNLAGKLSLLESAYLIKNARQTYVNDSAPMHLASAMNAPVTAFFCSTIPAFGFGPLSEKSVVVETQADLNCRPCGLHGFKECPKGHFDCGTGIQLDGL